MHSFKPGDRVRRVYKPTRNMPRGSEWTVRRVHSDGFLTLIDDPSNVKYAWYPGYFELVEEDMSNRVKIVYKEETRPIQKVELLDHEGRPVIQVIKVTDGSTNLLVRERGEFYRCKKDLIEFCEAVIKMAKQ